jgi:uncharacterized membrane protein SirB2
MDYFLIKHLHVTAVALSLSGFVLRGIWMLRSSPLLQARLTKVLPHLVDTVLLLSAIWLAVAIQQYPLVDGWLTAKVLGLIAYILLGTVALKRGPTLPIRLTAWIGALLVFGYIVLVALSKDPWLGVFIYPV